MPDKFKTTCSVCGRERYVSRSMLSLIKTGKHLGCKSCASKGNQRRFLGKPYDKALYNTSIYRSWYNMKTRCLNDNVPEYKRYGARGIVICDKWLTFSGFLEDMQASYRPGLSIERVDNDGHYCKENCKWATAREQANNTLNTKLAARYTYKGVTKRISEWASEFGIKRKTLAMRLGKYDWPIQDALLTPVKLNGPQD